MDGALCLPRAANAAKKPRHQVIDSLLFPLPFETSRPLNPSSRECSESKSWRVTDHKKENCSLIDRGAKAEGRRPRRRALRKVCGDGRRRCSAARCATRG